MLQNAAAEYQLPLPAASTIRTALELGAAVGGAAAVGIRSATSGDREAKRLAAVEALGGPEQLLGMSMEEVADHLGEPAECAGKATPSYLYGEDLSVLGIHLVYTETCQSVSMTSKWIDPLELDGATPQEVETALDEMEGYWTEGKVFMQNDVYYHVEEDDFESDGDYTEVTEETVYFFHQGPYRYTISVQLDGTVNQYSVSLEPSEEPPQTQPSPADYKKMYAQTAGFPGGEVSRLMADVTHDGAPELLLVSRNVEDGTEVSYVTVYTLNGEAPVEIYQNSINDASTSGTQSVYLYHENGKDYLYSLRTQLRSGTAAYDAEIFSLTAEGVQQPLYTHQVHGPLEESRTELEQFAQDVARYTDRELLIGFDGGVPQLPEAENSAYRSSLPDGTYELLLTGQYTAVDGGTMAAGHLRQRLAFTDAEVGNLQPGDVIPVSRYRDTGSDYGERYNAYEDLTVESAVYSPSGSSVEVNGMFFFVREDGVWYMEDLEGFDQVTPGEAVELFFPDGCTIEDWTGNARQKMRSSIQEVDSQLVQYGGQFTIENGAVTNAVIHYHS